MTAAQIVTLLETLLGMDGAPRTLRVAIEDVLITSFGLSPVVAAEHAERRQHAVAELILKNTAAADNLGTVTTLAVIGTMLDSIAGACYVLNNDPQEVIDAKQHRLQAEGLLHAMQALSFSEFEQFGARTLVELGATNCRITPHAGDQGIDFYGQLSLGQFQALPAPFVRLAHDIVLLFAGQAKHYPKSSIGPNFVRELIGSVSLARTKTFSRDINDVFSGLELAPFSPLVTLLFTTGDVTSGAVRLAKSAGIIVRSGRQLAAFLADRGVGMVTTAGRRVFDQITFSQWLNS